MTKDRLAIIWSKRILIAARRVEGREGKFKVLTVEVVSLRLISHPKKEATTFAQARINGATSGRRANKASNHEKSLETEANYFIINLK